MTAVLLGWPFALRVPAPHCAAAAEAALDADCRGGHEVWPALQPLAARVVRAVGPTRSTGVVCPHTRTATPTNTQTPETAVQSSTKQTNTETLETALHG